MIRDTDDTRWANTRSTRNLSLPNHLWRDLDAIEDRSRCGIDSLVKRIIEAAVTCLGTLEDAFE